jgi:hypothetical protein
MKTMQHDTAKDKHSTITDTKDSEEEESPDKELKM